MKPVTGYTMIKFLHWLAVQHPEAHGLRSLSEKGLSQLVNEFENGKLDGDDILKKKWVISFRFLFESENDWNGYREAREELKKFDMEETALNFESWLKKREHIEPLTDEDNVDTLLQQYLDSERLEDIDRYIGSIKSLRNGRIYQELTDQLVKMGVKQKVGKQTSDVDILERYRNIPLHAIFLYTWAHQDIESYISDNWGDLDTLSGDVCDIHQSIGQFKDAETAYDYIEKLDVVKMANFKEYSQLPGMFFWNNQGAWEYIPFGSKRSEADITNVVQVVFEEIHKSPTISSVTRAKKRLKKDGQLNMKEEPTKKKVTSWGELLAILLAFVVVISGIVFAAYVISPFVLWLALIAALLFLVLIIVYLKGPSEISEANFMRVIFRFFEALPLLNRGPKQEASSEKNDKGK